MACDVVIGYRETTTLFDDVLVMNICGTATKKISKPPINKLGSRSNKPLSVIGEDEIGGEFPQF